MTGSKTITLSDITIRTHWQAGDLPFIIQSHSDFYREYHQYGKTFDYYVIKGAAEFYEKYRPERSRVWIAEHGNLRIGSLCLMERGEAAQLRLFYINENYRGIGLGKHLLEEFVAFLKEKNYQSAYLWTTNEQKTAVALYQRFGFCWVEDVFSNSTFDRPVIEQKYELVL